MIPRFVLRLGAAVLLAASGAMAAAAPGAGDVPPPKVGIDGNAEPVMLTAFPGKAVVVSFWATWCAYCLQELPILHGIQKAAGKDNLQVIAVNTESREVFRKAVRTLRELDVLHAHDSDRRGQEEFGVKGIPHMVIIGRDGRIAAVYRGYSESSLESIVADINRALATPRSQDGGEKK